MTDSIVCVESGDAGDTVARWNGMISLLMLWSRTLTAQEMLWLAVEPYAFIQPRQQVALASVRSPQRMLMGVGGEIVSAALFLLSLLTVLGVLVMLLIR